MLHEQRKNTWLVCLLPFAVFMLVGSLEPSPPTETKPVGQTVESLRHEYRIRYRQNYAAKIGLTLAAIAFVLPGYRSFPWQLHFSAIAVGLIGVFVWVALSKLQHRWMPWIAETTGIEWFASLGHRSGINLLSDKFLPDDMLRYAFFSFRLFGLAVVVPVIEEFFLRGFVMRYVQDERWWEVPFGNVNRTAIIAGTLVPVLMHPQEALAALVWFSMITWLMIRTRSIGDCIVAHAITNLSLGVYVVASGNWWLM